MNKLHGWYCSSGRWARRLEERVLPWALGGADLGPRALEIGPGPGLTTNLLRRRAGHLTCVEIDPVLARRLRFEGVWVVNGDGTAMPFQDGSFTGAVSMTMLHHVPSAALQDALLAEVRRVLQPGAVFVGSDSTASLRFRLYHLFDVCVTVDPGGFAARLERAGFADPEVQAATGAFRFRATRR